jgi:hypothetical protein
MTESGNIPFTPVGNQRTKFEAEFRKRLGSEVAKLVKSGHIHPNHKMHVTTKLVKGVMAKRF